MKKTKWVMTTSCLQEKIDKLQNTVHALLHKSNYMAGVYVDDLARLNNEIHEQINDLYPCHGKTAEQEAALCRIVSLKAKSKKGSVYDEVYVDDDALYDLIIQTFYTEEQSEGESK